MRALSYLVNLRRALLLISAFYVLQVIFLLKLDPCETENGPASLLPSSFCDNVVAKQHGSSAGVIQLKQHNTITIEAPVSIPVRNDLVTDLGVRQRIYDINLSAAIRDRVAQARIYINDIVAVNGTYDKVRALCKNKQESCATLAVRGQCDVIPGMKFNCAPLCESCEQMDVDFRCKADPDAIDALYPGDLDRLYENITSNPAFEQYERKVFSRPSYAPGDTAETADYQLGPWMVVFDNVVTDEEADRLIELGSNVGYGRSEGVGKKAKDGTISVSRDLRRTSTTAWCLSKCAEDPTVRRVMNRIAAITGIPETNYEFLQILRYEKGQYYKTHNDFIDYQKNRSSGVRLLTFYVYLSDVDEGGGTKFPHLNLTVTPKKGRAVVWPSVLNDDPNSKDSRTDHAALEVTQGIKYGFNAWIHQRDFKSSFEKNCQ
jgi:prolyl 4-hydroxylase